MSLSGSGRLPGGAPSTATNSSRSSSVSSPSSIRVKLSLIKPSTYVTKLENLSPGVPNTRLLNLKTDGTKVTIGRASGKNEKVTSLLTGFDNVESSRTTIASSPDTPSSSSNRSSNENNGYFQIPQISKSHGNLFYKEGNIYFEDSNSKFGTKINGVDLRSKGDDSNGPKKCYKLTSGIELMISEPPIHFRVDFDERQVQKLREEEKNEKENKHLHDEVEDELQDLKMMDWEDDDIEEIYDERLKYKGDDEIEQEEDDDLSDEDLTGTKVPETSISNENVIEDNDKEFNDDDLKELDVIITSSPYLSKKGENHFQVETIGSDSDPDIDSDDEVSIIKERSSIINDKVEVAEVVTKSTSLQPATPTATPIASATASITAPSDKPLASAAFEVFPSLPRYASDEDSEYEYDSDKVVDLDFSPELQNELQNELLSLTDKRASSYQELAPKNVITQKLHDWIRVRVLALLGSKESYFFPEEDIIKACVDDVTKGLKELNYIHDLKSQNNGSQIKEQGKHLTYEQGILEGRIRVMKEYANRPTYEKGFIDGRLKGRKELEDSVARLPLVCAGCGNAAKDAIAREKVAREELANALLRERAKDALLEDKNELIAEFGREMMSCLSRGCFDDSDGEHSHEGDGNSRIYRYGSSNESSDVPTSVGHLASTSNKRGREEFENDSFDEDVESSEYDYSDDMSLDRYLLPNYSEEPETKFRKVEVKLDPNTMNELNESSRFRRICVRIGAYTTAAVIGSVVAVAALAMAAE